MEVIKTRLGGTVDEDRNGVPLALPVHLGVWIFVPSVVDRRVALLAWMTSYSPVVFCPTVDAGVSDDCGAASPVLPVGGALSAAG